VRGKLLLYLAEQSDPVQRQVALKIIKLGMDTKRVIARFDAERQMLMLMDHPNITRTFDGSMTAGGMFEFYLNGPVGSNYVVQVSSNLVNWVNLSTNAVPISGVRVYDFPIQTTQPRKFYRALPLVQ
jgi:serine/threonine protein kinase